MKYFAVLLPMKDVDKSQEFRPKHLEFLKNMRNSGQVAANGKFADGWSFTEPNRLKLVKHW